MTRKTNKKGNPRQGKAVAIMISPEELETLEILADARLIKSLVRAEADIKAGRLYPHDEIFGSRSLKRFCREDYL